LSKLQFEYSMELTYSEPVTECHYTLKCLPKNTDMQQIHELTIELSPVTDYQRDSDSFGNLTIYGNYFLPHTRFAVTVKGIAETWLSVSQKDTGSSAVFRHPYGLSRAGDGIRAYHKSLSVPSGPAYDAAMYLMRCLHRDFAYEQRITNMETSAEQAWTLGKGVCQDYAHILIALCHLSNIPARYVTGMMVGEGHSHAWVEILDHGYWYALDPTNNCIAADTYIKIGHGRTAKDCMLNKGIIKGGGSQKQAVTVSVQHIKELT